MFNNIYDDDDMNLFFYNIQAKKEEPKKEEIKATSQPVTGFGYAGNDLLYKIKPVNFHKKKKGLIVLDLSK
jgi:hypothetical protein